MTFFYSSAELRWFLDGRTGDWERILKWFRHDDAIPLRVEGSYDPKTVTDVFVRREAERTDDYLRFPDCDTVGVKQRQGKLEVKAVVTSPRPYMIASAGAAGRVDQWVKWGFASKVQAQLEVELDQAGPWRTVVKDRYLQKYAFESAIPDDKKPCEHGEVLCVTAVSPESRPDAGCNIELTKISVDASVPDWVTIGFEAFGPSGRVMAILDIVVEQFFAVHGAAPVPLTVRDSRSYAAWLADLN